MPDLLDEILFFLLPLLVVFFAAWIAKKRGGDFGTQVTYEFVGLVLLFLANFYSAVSPTFADFTIAFAMSLWYYLIVLVAGALITEFFSEKRKS